MNVLELTDTNFHQEVLKSPVPYLVDFWAVWCGPCRMMAPVLDEIASSYDDRLRVGKLNVDNEIKAANELNIQSIPTLILFVNGKEAERIIGAVPKDFLIEKIKKYLVTMDSEPQTKSKRGLKKEKK